MLPAWISGNESEFMETLTDDDVGQKCVEMLNLFLGKVRKIPRLHKVTRSPGRRAACFMQSCERCCLECIRRIVGLLIVHDVQRVESFFYLGAMIHSCCSSDAKIHEARDLVQNRPLQTDVFAQCTHKGGLLAEWLACWTQAQKGLSSNRSRGAVGWQSWANCSHPLCLCSPSSKIGSSPLKGCGGNCRPGGK